MNTFILTCLLCLVLYSVLGAQASEASSTGEPGSVSGFSASGEDLQGLKGNADDDDVDQNEQASEFLRDDRKKRKGKGKKKNKQKSRSTTASKAEHTFSKRGLTSTLETTKDPCTSTHLGFCIHGYCQHMEGLQEPVCICIKGYDGERCGIQTLETIKTRPERGSSDGVEWAQMALVITALVLSIISCGAVLLMACTHYRSKSILASYLGSCSEQQKLQKPASDVVV
ncbi:amphiregulin [Entelurus aequoreus]|uniref:amphiregulin n=1 Tax=Entelurus aequoreus TaxID=161455 RepID=UPI002B1E1081|nr:amphiregulin [Entelurus aequoreus]